MKEIPTSTAQRLILGELKHPNRTWQRRCVSVTPAVGVSAKLVVVGVGMVWVQTVEVDGSVDVAAVELDAGVFGLCKHR